MTYVDKINAIITNPKYGTPVTVTSVSIVNNSYGDPTETYTGTSSVYGVIWNYTYENGQYAQAGQLKEGEMFILFPASTNIAVNYHVIYNGKAYVVKSLPQFPLGGVNLAIQALVKEIV